MIKIYHNPRCAKSREALLILKDRNLDIEVIEYIKNGLSIAQIQEILEILGAKPLDIIRKNEKEFKEFNLRDLNLDDQDLIKKLSKSPKLLQRPIVINHDKAIIARPPENVIKIL